jgi:hypothetical protein
VAVIAAFVALLAAVPVRAEEAPTAVVEKLHAGLLAVLKD